VWYNKKDELVARLSETRLFMPTIPISIAPEGNRLQTADGRPFFAVIVNYVGHRDRAWAQFMPGRFDPALIEDDFRLARRAGANTIRTFVAAPLQNEFTRGDWSKLDALVEAGRRADVYLLLTLADYGPTYVQSMAAHARLIAEHFRGDPTILGYDLYNEPRFYNLALLHYPQPVPLLTADLAAIYPAKQSPAEALAWARGEGRVPAWVSDADAIRYAHAYTLYKDFLAAASAWANGRNLAATVAHFMRAPEAQPWQPFLDALDATLAAWLAPQAATIRSADPGRLITVGWSDPILAGLPANAQLDFLSLHRYPPAALRWLDYHLRMATALIEAFPGKPVLLTEFGYPTSDLDLALAAIYESIGWLRACELGLAGVGKWMLWDLPPGPNPRERSFGLYAADGVPKPGALALSALRDALEPCPVPCGPLVLGAGDVPSYSFVTEQARLFGGNAMAGDDVVRWEGIGPGQIFAIWPAFDLVRIRATAAGQVTFDPGRLYGDAELEEYDLRTDGVPCPHERSGSALQFRIAPPQVIECRYRLAVPDPALQPDRGPSTQLHPSSQRRVNS
jgi:hypothetical protein